MAVPDPPPTVSGGLRDESGFMLMELLVVVALFMVVVGATVSLLDVGSRSASRDQAFADEISAAEAGLGGMVHEIRQATSVTATTPNYIDFVVTLAGQPTRVAYECDVSVAGTSFRRCVRLSAAGGAPLPPLATGRVVAAKIANGTLPDPVFTFSPNGIAPIYVEVKLALPAAGNLPAGKGLDHNTVLDAGAYLRNLDVAA